MRNAVLGILIFMHAAFAIGADPVCVNTEDEFNKMKDKFPAMFQKLPLYMKTEPNAYGASAVEIMAIDGKFKSHGFTVKKKSLFSSKEFATEENADLSQICFNGSKITLESQKFEMVGGVKKIEDPDTKVFKVTGDSKVDFKVLTVMIPFTKVSQSDYNKFYKMLEDTSSFPQGYGPTYQKSGVQ